MRELKINNQIINDDTNPFVVAEIGHNHGGNLETCKEMVRAAKLAGADAVKLQRIDAKKLFTKTAYNTPYNSENAFAETYGKHRDFLTLKDDDFRHIRDLCEKLNMTFICTAFEEWSADFLNELGIHAFKVASFHAKDTPLLRHIRQFNKPMIISTGHCLLSEVKQVYKQMHGSKFALLQCTSEYPVRNPKHINLGAITTFKGMFPDTIIGYSHHYHEPYPAAVSALYGAKIIEIHLTLNRAQKGTDHSFSLEPDGLRWLVRKVRLNREICGFVKTVYSEEQDPIAKMSRSIYPGRAIKRGEKITDKDIRYRAPAQIGLAPFQAEELIGKFSLIDLSTAEAIKPDDVRR